MEIAETSLEKSKELGSLIVEYSKKKVQDALLMWDLKEFLQAEKNIRVAQQQDAFQWIFELESGVKYTKEDFFSAKMYGNDESVKQKEERLAKEMYKSLEKANTENPGLVPVSLRRFRTGKDDWKYRVLAHFPANTQIIDPKYDDGDIKDHEDGYLLYNATVECANHACDVLYKRILKKKKESWENGEQVEDFLYLPYISPKQFRSSSGGRIEFKDPETGELRNAEVEVMRALVGCYSNLTHRYRIPTDLLKSK